MIARSAFVVVRKASIFSAFIALVLMTACGGHLEAGGPVAQFPEGSVTSEEVEQLLKFDARVQDFEIDGNKLIVNVNQSWMSSPPGIQERAMGRWYGYWQVAHGGNMREVKKGIDVVARFDGKEIAHWTEEGYKAPEKESKSEQAKSE